MISTQPSTAAKFLLYSAAFIIVVAGMKSAESLLVPFLLSIFIAVICSPPLAWMHKKGVPYIIALLVIIGVIVIFVLSFFENLKNSVTPTASFA